MNNEMINTAPEVNSYTVYMHTCPNGKRYIGITQQTPEKRWREGKGYRNNLNFVKAIKKYGWNNLSHEILYSGLSKRMAEMKEIELIAKYKSNQKEFGYNIDNGGHSGGTRGEETRKKISATRKGQTAGRKHWHYNQHWNERVRKKMSESHAGTSERVKCVETGSIYNSIREAARQKNISHNDISKCCRGVKYYNTAGGYHWQFAKEEIWQEIA